MNTTSICRLCGGPLGLLGQLGTLRWFLCRNCGMQFARRVRARRKAVRP